MVPVLHFLQKKKTNHVEAKQLQSTAVNSPTLNVILNSVEVFLRRVIALTFLPVTDGGPPRVSNFEGEIRLLPPNSLLEAKC